LRSKIKRSLAVSCVQISLILGVSTSKEMFNGLSTARQVVIGCGEGEYLAGKTAVVTGGNSGIGLETCKALASAGCKVILCSRSVPAGEKAVRDEIVKSGLGGYVAKSENIVVKALDLASLQSTKAFADGILATEPRIDFLVLNAGIMALPSLERTDTGFEKQIGVNHFGHYYLTRLLLPKMLEQSHPSRVVTVASSAHSFGEVFPDDLNYRKGRAYSAWAAYGQTKGANILFAKGLADRLQKKNSNIASVSIHPGVIRTNLWRASFLNQLASFLVTSKSIPQGAATTVYACVAPQIQEVDMQGAYLDDCKAATPTTATCRDATGEMRERLWVATESELSAALREAGLPELPPF